jgi:hypothetical protein
MTISFPLRVTFTPEINYVKIVEAPTANCPGSFEEPKAEPEKLCIYQKRQSNAVVPPTEFEGTSDPTSGVTVEFEVGEETEAAEAWGSWAVKAP